MVLKVNNLEKDEIIEKTGDSTLKSYDYSEGILKIHLELYDIDNELFLEIPTNSIVTKEIIRSDTTEIDLCCYIKITKLEEVLKTEHGYYIPSSDFPKLMKEIKAGCNVAYGKKCADNDILFSLIGYGNLLTCFVRNGLSDIKFRLE